MELKIVILWIIFCITFVFIGFILDSSRSRIKKLEDEVKRLKEGITFSEDSLTGMVEAVLSPPKGDQP